MGLFGSDKIMLESVVSADTRQYDRALDKSKKKTLTFTKKISASFTGMGKTVKRSMLAISAATVGTVAVTWKLIGVVTTLGDEIDKNSKRMGISIEAYQRMRIVAELSGTTIDNLNDGFIRMNRRIDQARQSTASYNKTFGRLGISMSEIKDLSPDQIFYKTRTALAELQSVSKRTAITADIFGARGAREMLPLISQTTAEFDKMSKQANSKPILEDKTVENAAKFKDEMTLIKASVINLLGEGMAPIVNKLKDVLKTANEWLSISSNQEGTIKLISEAFGLVMDAVGWGVQTLKDWKGPLTFIAGVATGISDVFLGIWKIVSWIVGGVRDIFGWLLKLSSYAGYLPGLGFFKNADKAGDWVHSLDTFDAGRIVGNVAGGALTGGLDKFGKVGRVISAPSRAMGWVGGKAGGAVAKTVSKRIGEKVYNAVGSNRVQGAAWKASKMIYKDNAARLHWASDTLDAAPRVAELLTNKVLNRGGEIVGSAVPGATAGLTVNYTGDNAIVEAINNFKTSAITTFKQGSPKKQRITPVTSYGGP